MKKLRIISEEIVFVNDNNIFECSYGVCPNMVHKLVNRMDCRGDVVIMYCKFWDKELYRVLDTPESEIVCERCDECKEFAIE